MRISVTGEPDLIYLQLCFQQTAQGRVMTYWDYRFTPNNGSLKSCLSFYSCQRISNMSVVYHDDFDLSRVNLYFLYIKNMTNVMPQISK